LIREVVPAERHNPEPTIAEEEMMRKVRQTLIYITLLLVMTALFAACAAPQAPAQPAEKPAQPEEAEQPAPAEEAQAPTTLVIGLAEDTVSMDPGRSYETHAGTVHAAIYETLVTFPPDRVDEIIPGVADSWEISEDGLKYTFQLKENRVFSTGRNLTAADVAFSIMRMKHITGNPSFLADNIENVEATGEYEVVITLADPDPSLLARLAFSGFGIIDSEEAKAHGATADENAVETDTAEEWLNSNSIGSGPYMMEKWEPTVETILVRNPEFVGEPAAIERVIYRSMDEAAAQKIALEAGDLDIAIDVTPEQVASLKQNPDITVFEGVSDWVFFLLMNMDPDVGGPMSEDAVQDAVRLAIDDDGVKALAGGSAAIPVNIMPVHWAYALDQSERITRDVEAAKAKLAEAGYGDGLDVTLEYPEFTVAGISWATLAQKVQSDLNEAGFNVSLKPADLQVSLEAYRNGEQAFSLWAWHPDFVDPVDRTAFMPGGNVGLRANWTEERASDELVEVTHMARVATDPAEREDAFTRAQELMLDESAFAFLVQPGLQVAYRNNIEGFAYNNQWRVNPYTMSKSD
jgi:peptide/nickel transport system substrate-binding protein